ncbi:related to nucleoside-diphosphate-sugar epimerases [Phialocephala subalpina]|uniref:Related to nucleoside-diphosphate-sugar epimerases n=1 Tax=Phialocephala subalpina TaxID=576137 RepID=A0A1L7XKX2_9HELO|nr:related to nucleoside-diphosphate-sugar epimerases [Phialocephala subalpina]
MASNKKILVTGATGKQGGAVIKALQESSPSFQILALTRNASSKGAQALASKPNTIVVEGDHTSLAPIFEKHKPIFGVFSVTVMDKEGSEEAQAKPLIDESVKNGVELFVFTSVDRGGEKSDTNPTNIPHFASKHRIEEYLKEKSANGTKMPYTILRPVCFMDNLTPDFMGKGFNSMWAGVGTKPLQLVSTRDIGIFAANAFNNPSAYKNRSISLAGDELNIEQGRKVFKDTMGSDLPETFGFVGSGIKYMIKEMGTMFNWFKTDGYGADIQALRKEEPRLQNLSQWLKESSKFSK